VENFAEFGVKFWRCANFEDFGEIFSYSLFVGDACFLCGF
jgi:hypothetical protein